MFGVKEMKVWIIANDEVQPVDVEALETDHCYIIPIEDKKKIYVWAGSQCPKMKLYKAGTLATKLKSTERLYGFEINNIEQGSEPEDFPLSAVQGVMSPNEREEEVALPPRKVALGAKPAKLPKRAATLSVPPTEKNESIADTIAALKADIADIKSLVEKIWEKVEGI
jgi:hypothetical protein